MLILADGHYFKLFVRCFMLNEVEFLARTFGKIYVQVRSILIAAIVEALRTNYLIKSAHHLLVFQKDEFAHTILAFKPDTVVQLVTALMTKTVYCAKLAIGDAVGDCFLLAIVKLGQV